MDIDTILVPASGATVSNLQVEVDAAAAGSGNTVQVLDNGTPVFSCPVLVGTTTCSNSGSVAIAAGHRVQVRVVNNAGAASQKYSVSFRW